MDSNQISGLGFSFWDLENIHMKSYRETTYLIRICQFFWNFLDLDNIHMKFYRETIYLIRIHQVFWVFWTWKIFT